jgi:hypothetical protein
LPATLAGNDPNMVGGALALVILGIFLLFLFPWAGIVVGAAGLVLLLLFLIAFGRRAAAGRP